jgi:hypothetical protein
MSYASGRESHAITDARLCLELEICFPQKNWRKQRSVMDEDDDFLESDRTNPANDNLARAFRWIGLFCGLAMLAWTAVLLS